MKVYGELFKGKKQALQKRAQKGESTASDSSWTPYVWNNEMEDDELCL